MSIIRNKHGQSTLEYIVVVTALVIAIVLAAYFIRDKLSGDTSQQAPVAGTLYGQADELMRCGATKMNYESPF